jgi:acyl phosphate:glycerol-3-phosphate acyltransferase
MLLWLLINAFLVLCAYGLGSIPTGYLAGRWLKGVDIRDQGSGSMGATNVLRTLGKVPAIAVLVIDVCKGAFAIAIVQWLYSLPALQSLRHESFSSPETWLPWMATFAGLAALLGHSKPVWLNFKGGKSVASSLGVLLALSWPVALSTVAVFAITIALTRIVSISSISAAIAVAIWMIVFDQPLAYILFGMLGGLYVVWLHRTNIQRLMTGTEPKVGQKLPTTTTVTSNEL